MKKIPLILCLSLALMGACAPSQSYEYPFQNPELSFAERADDLLGRLTLEEKISQLNYQSKEVERLGVPEYNWWNECLHGVARSGLATVFPQAIGLAATWDKDLMHRVAVVISDEGRAKYHDYIARGKRGIYQGITFWTPNINIFRDPRWGRGMETYGECPFLTGEMAAQFITGIQGDDPRYYKAIATSKHWGTIPVITRPSQPPSILRYTTARNPTATRSTPWSANTIFATPICRPSRKPLKKRRSRRSCAPITGCSTFPAAAVPRC
jgi:hypothetical protein